MSNIKLVMADLDGTLLDDEGNLGSETIETVKKLREKDILFSLASGRNRVIMKDFVKALDIEIPYMSDNGANVFKGDECLSTSYFDKEYNNFILDVLNREKLPFNGYSTRSAYYNLESPRLLKVRGRLSDKLKHEIFNNDLDFSNEAFYKITLDSLNNDHMDKVVEEISSRCPNVYMKKAEGTFYSIVLKGVDKGKACLKMAEILNIEPKEIMVFGDNNNDVSMFKVVEESVCVNNANDDIKALAKYTCLDNNHEGPAKFMEEYFNL